MSTDTQNTTPDVGRNEPCPCGSGKKYKRCHGVSAAPKLTTPKFAGGGMPSLGAPGAGAPPGFDPSQMDPAMMAQMAQMLQRLPKGQMAKLQSLMQQAMAGKDVSREAEAFERTLPVEFQSMLQGMKLPGMGDMAGAPMEDAAPAAEMTPEQARKLVEEAAKSGKISAEEAASLLAAPAAEAPSAQAIEDAQLDAKIAATEKKKGGLFGWGKKG